MDIDKVTIGEDPPRGINVLIEIPQQAERMITSGIRRAADKGDAVASRLVAGRSLQRSRERRGG